MPEPTRDTMVDGRYRVVSRLGSGGMADVFLAEDQQLGRKVALKLLHRRFAEDPDFVERFRREAQAAAGLQHPNVVGVYDRGEYDGTYYIAMEYLPGRTLKQLIREEAPLDPIRAIDITIQILKAARFAHRRGIIHRDLKPHNVMIDDAGDAKVTDFGIARAGASDMTETGSIMISPLPGVTNGKPGAAMTALPGVAADVVDDEGNSVPNGSGGYLVLTEPWPAMLRTIWGDDARYVDTYWSRFPGKYFAGDGAKRDTEGDIWLLGRVDDVMNISGHRLSTTEIESALVSNPKVAEAAVVGASDEMTGQAIVAFVILRSEAGDGGPDVVQELRAHVVKEIGKIAQPRQIMVVAELPKTRSGKIMRRLLRDVAENRPVGDVTTLADTTVMESIKAGMVTSTED